MTDFPAPQKDEKNSARRLLARSSKRMLGDTLCVVVVEGGAGKEYRKPTLHEFSQVAKSQQDRSEIFSRVPYVVPDETISSERPSPNTRGASGLPRFGIDRWEKVFTDRQIVSIGFWIG